MIIQPDEKQCEMCIEPKVAKEGFELCNDCIQDLETEYEAWVQKMIADYIADIMASFCQAGE